MATRFAKARAHQPADPKRQRDFGNQHDRGFAARKGRLDRAQINFCLAAAGYAVQQRRSEFSSHQPAPDFSERQLLLGFSTFAGGVKSVSQGSSSGVSGSSHVCRRPVFSRRDHSGARDLRLPRSRFERQRATPVAASTSRTFSSAALEGCARSSRDSTRRFSACAFCDGGALRARRDSRGGRVFRRQLLHRACGHAGFGERAFGSLDDSCRSGRRNFRSARFYVREFVASWRVLQIRAARSVSAIFAVMAQFDFGRQHGAKCFADGREVVAADPLAEFDQLWWQRGNAVEQLGNFLDAFGVRRAIGDRQSHANHRAIAERHEHASPDKFFAIARGRHGVSERRSQRHRQRDFQIALSHRISRIV